jgi:carbonic anhydrase
MMDSIISGAEALNKLKAGNRAWRETGAEGDLSPASVMRLTGGQTPYAVVLTCSDSRVVPEAVFGAGTGELFVIRTAGNTVGRETMGSIEYAVDHLGVRLVLILGHTGCGVVGAALADETGEHIEHIVAKIAKAAGGETDPYKACCLNVEHAAAEVRQALDAMGAACFDEVVVAGAVFHLEDGKVTFLQDAEKSL